MNIWRKLLLFGVQFLILYHYATTEDIKDLNSLQLLKLVEDISQILPYDVKSSDVQFFIRTQTLPETLITPQNLDVIDVTKKSTFVIHGWLENHKRTWYTEVGDEYLKSFDINFIEVDWERPARMSYIASARNTRLIGEEIAKFIQDTNMLPNDIHIIGHSLGSHVAGFAGKRIYERTGQKLARITALDPAGPYFREALSTPNERLDKTDANIVDVIHTDAGFYGYEAPIGTLDIYVNGGQRIQPGCFEELLATTFGEILERSFCSHARSTKYFTNWINNGKFACQFCDPLLGYIVGGKCFLHHEDLTIGSEDVSSAITGICFAATNKEEPYLT